MTNIWAISTNKGGVLKTTTTTNLAGVLAKNHQVLIIDSDNQGNCLLSFGLNPDDYETTLYDCLVSGRSVEDAIVNVHGNIDLLPANDDMAFFEFDVLANPKAYPEPFYLLRKAIAPILDEYDYILIDTPPNLGLTQGNVLSAATDVLIPFQPESYSMRSLLKILKAIKDFREQHNPDLSILGVLATLVDGRTTLHSQVLQDCRKLCEQLSVQMFETVIPRSVRFASSVAFEGLPATISDQNHPIVTAYYDLMKEIEHGAKQRA